MENKKFVDGWDETRLVSIDKKNKKIKIMETEVKKTKVPTSKIAICDLCNGVIGRFDEIKYIIEPEYIIRAIKKGLVPRGECAKLLASYGDRDGKIALEVWRELSLDSETPWALCDSCNKELEKILGR
jgi:hypothetical protein